MRRTKIVCTLGPSSNDFSTIERIMLEGMDVARGVTAGCDLDDAIDANDIDRI